MNTAENKDFIRHLFAEMSKGNVDAYLNSLAEDGRFIIIGTSKYSGVFNGKQEFIDRVLVPLTSQLDGELRLTIDNLIAEGDYVVMQSRGQSKTKAGKTYNNTYCHVFRLAEGKVQELVEYLDPEVITAAFGR
jgi:ketosteroid isomerase-like protein